MPDKFSDKDALIIVDIQNDFCDDGVFELKGGNAIVQPVNEAAKHFQNVILTQDWHTQNHASFASSHHGQDPYCQIEMPYGTQTLWPDHCVMGSWGADFHPDLDTTVAQLVVRKGFRSEIDSYSAFFENDGKTTTGLTGYLQDRGIEHLYFCGIATDFCVAWSAIDAINQGFKTTLFRNLSKEIDLDGSLQPQLDKMSELGVSIENF